MKKIAATLFAGAAAAAMLAAPAAAENLSFYNHASNWEAALGADPGGTWTCVKTEVSDYMASVDSSADVVIVKGGNGFNVYWGGGTGLEAPEAGKSGKAAAVSWYMECNEDNGGSSGGS